MTFVALDNSVIRLDTITSIKYVTEDQLSLIVTHSDGVDTVTGFHAIELLWLIKPSALEGKWKHWHRHMWSVHNLIAHPIMQLLAYMRLYRWAIWVHDVTVPSPKNPREHSDDEASK